MKQKDIILIAVVVFVSGVLSFVLSSMFINSPKNRTAEVEVVEAITDEFPALDTKFFHDESINPTQTVRIGDQDPNDSPFQGEQRN